MKYLYVAIKNLLRRPMRSGLTLLGIAIGIAMLFSFMALNEGYQAGVQNELSQMGVHMLAIAKGCPYEATQMILHGGEIEDYLSTAELQQITQFPGIERAVGMFMNQIIDGNKTIIINGYTDEAFELKPWWVIRGERFVDANSVILPEEMAQDMGLTIGSNWVIHGIDREFTVTGLLEKTGSQDDQSVYMPMETAQELFNAHGMLTSVAIQLSDMSQVENVIRMIESLPDVQAITMGQVISNAQSFMETLQALITSVVIIAIFIGAIGVMNSIFMSVVERTKEIGMMKAVGAGSSDIFTLVWLESIILSVTGGLLGIAAAIGAASLVEGAVRDFLPFAPVSRLITFNSSLVVTCLVAATVMGTIAGAYPAWRASLLSPMEAIRSE